MIGRAAQVLIVDGDAAVRQQIARVCKRDGLPVREAAGGEDALEAASICPAAVVLEVDLPDVDGFEVCRELRERHGGDLPLIMISGDRVSAHDRVAGLLIGADDYLVKPVNGDELLVRLRRLLARSRSSTARTAERREGLSPRELEVVRLLAAGLSGAAIAEQLVISHKTVAAHLQRVMAKLGVHTRAQLVAEAYRLGLAGGVDRSLAPV